MPRINGLLETALYVDDVRRSAEFYRRLFGFGTLLESDRLIALDISGKNILLLFLKGATREDFTLPGGGVIPGHEGSGTSHLAFSISPDEEPKWVEFLASQGVMIESTVTWDGGSRSLYFRDPDGHLVELMTPGFWWR